MPDGPTLLPVQVDTIPAALRAMDRWVLWNLETRDGSSTKVPYQAKHPAAKADATNANTWADFATARDAYQDGKADGLGFVLGDGVFGFDIDDCRDPQTGAIAPDVAAYIRLLNTYTEVSPRGAGLHAIGRGHKPGGRCRTGRYELYDAGRFFCITGQALADMPTTIEERPAELAKLYTLLFPPKSNGDGQLLLHQQYSLDDATLIATAMTARNGSLFASLWAGDTSPYGSDDSAADLALCNLLAFWTSGDSGRMDRLFRCSGLMREKWDSRRGDQTYGGLTIAKAIANCTETYGGPSRPALAAPAPTSDPPLGLDPTGLSDATDVAAEGLQIGIAGVQYVVDGIIPDYGMLGMLVAYAKVGKTTFAQQLAAAVATGQPFLGRPTRQTRVLIIAAEDPPEYTAWLARHLSTLPRDVLTFYRRSILLDRAGLTQIAAEVRAKNYGLVLISSWQAVVRGLIRDENDNAGAVRVVEDVKAFTRHTGVPWLIDAHSGKGEDQGDDADPNKAMRGASSAAGAADYMLSLRYAHSPFGTQRRLSGKGRFVSVAPLVLDYDVADGTYTALTTTSKHAIAETTWELICETGALTPLPQSADAIARAAGLTSAKGSVSGARRRQVYDALHNRDGVVKTTRTHKNRTTTLYAVAPDGDA